MKADNNGFSLLELICCITICCGASAIVFPTMMHIRTNFVIKTAAIELLGDLQLAKLSAIKYNCFVVVLFEQDSYSVFVDDGNEGGVSADWVRQPSEKLLVKRTLPPDLSTSLTYSNNRFRFDGLIGMKPGNIRINSVRGDLYKVVINNYARLRLVKES